MTKEFIKSAVGIILIASSGGYIVSLYLAGEKTNEELTEKYQEKESAYKSLMEENGRLFNELYDVRTNARDLKSRVVDLNTAVSTLEKYAKTDKELLEKYSKVYFLNENYVPEGLGEINSSYLLEKNRVLEFHSKAHPFLVKLMEEAKASGQDLLIASAYRSFGVQTSLKSSYKMTFGTTAANKFSADQGYSEHQLGTTLDFTTSKIGGALSGFEKTKEYDWLRDNAHRFGFVLSYPSGNKYYIFEPWHWRFVGIALATQLHEEGKNFYDMDQRDINEYLVRIFD